MFLRSMKNTPNHAPCAKTYTDVYINNTFYVNAKSLFTNIKQDTKIHVNVKKQI